MYFSVLDMSLRGISAAPYWESCGILYGCRPYQNVARYLPIRRYLHRTLSHSRPLILPLNPLPDLALSNASPYTAHTCSQSIDLSIDEPSPPCVCMGYTGDWGSRVALPKRQYSDPNKKKLLFFANRTFLFFSVS